MRITPILQRSFKLGLLLAAASLLGACAGLSSPSPYSANGFNLVSPGRLDNAMLTQPYAGKNPANPNCVGENLTPALSWVRAPAGTRSFAIVMDDQAGRAGLGVNHWTAYGIPATVTGLAEGEASAPSSKLVMGKNTLGMAYLGPCPPRGNAPQHYVYTLIATSLAPDALPPGLSKAELMEALKGKALGAASLVLRFSH
ncbi:MAG: YbhB/YbcL family Raf kinase inhibitor-like protein [Hylemonella sp.]|nr:YbhB/YbcL family Raf kinase inhibitor-like protein [Hylemonella sp.]